VISNNFGLDDFTSNFFSPTTFVSLPANSPHILVSKRGQIDLSLSVFNLFPFRFHDQRHNHLSFVWYKALTHISCRLRVDYCADSLLSPLYSQRGRKTLFLRQFWVISHPVLTDSVLVRPYRQIRCQVDDIYSGSQALGFHLLDQNR
jgi:hypothetical protein